jgi:hypothetical protein
MSLPAVLIVLGSSSCRYGSQTGDRVSVDLSMAEKTVGWLEVIRRGADDSEIKDYFMREIAPTPGCRSIIRHWRRFMKWGNSEFYRFIMEALDRIPTDTAVRDESGNLTIFGRRQAFWQSVLNDPERIQKDLGELKAASLIEASLGLAKEYLPEEAVVRSSLFIVVFGASSAYAVGDANGFDLLQLPRRSDDVIDVDDVVRTFAHEMHHTGISYWQKKHMPGGARIESRLNLIGRLTNEGMPSYYINQFWRRLHALGESRNPTQRALARDWERHLARLPDIYAEAERDIRLNLEGKITDKEIMQTWMAGTEGPAYVLGSDMFSTIDSYLGREAAFEVARDYRQLLVIYNRAAKIGNQAGGRYYVFDEVLASRVSNFTGRLLHRIFGWLF